VRVDGGVRIFVCGGVFLCACACARRKNLGIWNNSRALENRGFWGFLGKVQKQGFLGVFGVGVFFEVFGGVRFFFLWRKKSFVCVEEFFCVCRVMNEVVECCVCVVVSLCGVPPCVCVLASQLGVPNWGGPKWGVQRVPNELFIKVWG